MRGAGDPPWLDPDGRLDSVRLLTGFLQFWSKYGQPLMGAAAYKEIAAQLVLRKGDVTLGVELKVWRQGRKDPQAEGIAQLDRYLDDLGVRDGWLVIFDQRPDLPPIEDRTSASTLTSPAGHTVVVVRA